MAFHIRQATKDDVDDILQLIVGLAVYEREPDAVKATPDLLRKNLFDEKVAHALLAFPGPAPAGQGQGEVLLLDRENADASVKPKAIGLAIYFFNFSTWTGRPGLYLEDLYVKPEHRAGGVGKAFFAHLGRIAQEKDCGRMDWSVLKWNQPSIDFYEKRLGAKAMTEWMGMRLEEEGIDALKTLV